MTSSEQQHPKARNVRLLVLDVDGVLAPIVERADQAELLPGMTETLTELAELVHLAVVSGRAVGDLERILSRVALQTL